MSEEPKPCPMCGAEIAQNDDGMYWHPHGSCILAGIEFRDVEAWNQRAKPVVKALQWEGDGHWSKGPDEGWMEEATTPFGWGYSIEFGKYGEGNFVVDSTFDWRSVGHETPDEAKAAAQADFTRRVHACLDGYEDV